MRSVIRSTVRGWVLGALAGTLVAGCSHPPAQPVRPASPRASVEQGAADDACCARCPQALPEVEVVFETSPQGPSIVFRAPEERRADLRTRVRALSRYHNSEGARLAMIRVAHRAEAQETEAGMRLTLRAEVAADAAALKRQVRNQVEWMQLDNCAPRDDGTPCMVCWPQHCG